MASATVAVLRRKHSCLGVVICVVVAGCADPYGDPASSTATARPRATEGIEPGHPSSTGDATLVDPRPASLSEEAFAPATLSRLRSLVHWYAHTAVNWDWRTLADQLSALRRRSAGALSAELTAAIRGTRRDESLARDRPASAGSVAAVSVQGTGASRRLVVVTREQETASGVEPLGPASHRVYLGEARRFADGWRIVAWRRAP